MARSRKAGKRKKASKPARAARKEAGRKEAGRKEEGAGDRAGFLTPQRRQELIGAFLVAVAVVTAATFVSPGGTASQRWLGLLDWAFGWGALAFALLLGALGVWLVLDAVDGRIDITRDRPVAAAITALALLAIVHILAAFWLTRGVEAGDVERLRSALEAGAGGGRVGYGTAFALSRNLGAIPSLALLLVVVVVGLSVVAGRSITETLHVLGEAMFALGRRVRQAFDELRGPGATDEPSPDGAEGETWPAPAPAEPPAQAPEDAASEDAAEAAGAGAALAADRPAWRLPGLAEVLEASPPGAAEAPAADDAELMAAKIETTLAEFGVPVEVVTINRGPRITQFGLEPGYVERRGERARVKVSRIVSLRNDLALALAAAPIRIQAPVPGRPYLGIEVPNQADASISLRAILEGEAFRHVARRGALPLALGRDIGGQDVVADLARMPHLLIAGATGSGKSVAINALVCSLLVSHTPETLKLLLVDPKRVELVGYRGLPHLAAPVVVDVERVVGVLQWLVREMDRRYKRYAEVGARNIEAWNAREAAAGRPPMPYLVLIIDELADLMMVAPEEAERLITRLAQLARATGIHLVLATQRPSVDVVTGLIKANFPARMAFAVSSSIDSRVILDAVGAEKLLGRGDMLYQPSDEGKIHRLQGCYLSDAEIERLVRFWRHEARRDDGAEEGEAAETELTLGLPEPLIQPDLWERMVEDGGGALAEEKDALWDEAVALVRRHRTASTSFLQRKLRIGYSRAARLLDELEAAGVVGPAQGNQGREVLLAEGEEPEGGFQDRLDAAFDE